MICEWCGGWGLDYEQNPCAPAGEMQETSCRVCGLWWEDVRGSSAVQVPDDDANEGGEAAQ